MADDTPWNDEMLEAARIAAEAERAEREAAELAGGPGQQNTAAGAGMDADSGAQEREAASILASLNTTGSDSVVSANGDTVVPLVITTSAPTSATSAPVIPPRFEQLVPDQTGSNQFAAWASSLQKQVSTLSQLVEKSTTAVQDLASIQADKESAAKLEWKNKGLRIQYEKNAEFQKQFRDIVAAAHSGDVKRAEEAAKKGIALTTERNKLVRMADVSDGGWAVVDKYTAHPLAADEDDDKKIRRAQKEALKDKAAKEAKSKASRKRSRPAASFGSQAQQYHSGGFKFVGSARNQGQFQQSTPIPTIGGHRNKGLSEACFHCGAMGHIRRNCPELVKSNKCKSSCLCDLCVGNMNVDVGFIAQSAACSEPPAKCIIVDMHENAVEQSVPVNVENFSSDEGIDINVISQQSESDYLQELYQTDKIHKSSEFTKNDPLWNDYSGLQGKRLLMTAGEPVPFVHPVHKFLSKDYVPKVFVDTYEEYEQGKGDISVVNRLSAAIPFLEKHRSNPYVIDVLKNGYIPPLIRLPPNAIFRNNASARMHIVYVWQAVSELLDTKAASETKCIPHVVNPLTVAIRESDQKPRLVLDSRFLNLYIIKHKIKFEGADVLLQYIQKGSHMVNTDLKSGYHAILLNKFYRRLFGFSVVDEWGETRYFYFNVLPFGLTSAGFVFSKVLRAWVMIWREQGIRVVFFLDDGTVVALGYLRTLQHGQIVRRDLVSCGWVPHRVKSVWKPRQDGTFLGFIYLLAKAMIKATQDKVDRTRSFARDLLEQQTVSARALASIVGKVQSLQLAMGDIVFLRTRSLQRQVNECEYWSQRVALADDSVAELDFWYHMIDEFNGQYFLENPAAGTLVYSDASATGYAAFTAPPPHDVEVVVHRDFTPEEQNESSTFRELTAVDEGLRDLTRHCKNTIVDWRTDSANTAIIVKRGSRIPDLQKLAVRIFNTCRLNNIKLRVIWIPREENQRADFLSKVVDFDDWEVRSQWFEQICSYWGRPSVDRFASSRNAKVARFNSRFFENDSEAVDAFTQDWGGELNYLAPPLYLIPRAIKHARLCQSAGILVFPVWRAAPFWPVVVQEFEREGSGFVDTVVLGNIFSQGTQYKSIFGSPTWKSDTYVVFFDYRVA